MDTTVNTNPQAARHWYDSLPLIGSGFDILGSGYNFFKDIFGIDRNRDFDTNARMLELQNRYNTQSQYRSFQQQQFLARMQQKYNEENMSTQFAMNDYLSNRGRDIINSRRAGVNPSALSGSSAGSVSLPSAPSAPASPALAVGGSSYARPVSFTPPSSLSSDLSTTSEHMANANYRNLQSLNELIKTGADIGKLISESEKNLADAGYTKEQIKHYHDNLIHLWDLWKAQAENQRKQGISALKQGDAAIRNAGAAEKQADAAAQNAETRVSELEETTRHNKRSESLTAAANKIAADGVQVDRDKVDAIVNELNARARSENAQAGLTDQEIMWYADKMYTILSNYVWDTQGKKQKAILTEMQNDFFISDKVLEYLDTVLDHVENLTPVGKAKVMNQVKQRVKYHDQRGNLHFDERTINFPAE